MGQITRISTCGKDCYGNCVFEGIWDDNAPEKKLIRAIPLTQHPFTRGFFCAKMKNRQDYLYHSDRLKTAKIRSGPKGSGQFQNLSISDALEKIALSCKKTLASNGPKSILGAFYSGNSHLISVYSPFRFFGAIGARISGGGICNEGGIAGLQQMFGTYSTTNPFQINSPETKLIINWGSNLSETNVHAYTMVKQAIKRGVVLINIDSRRTAIAKDANIAVECYPGTEHLIAQLLLHYLITHDSPTGPVLDHEFLNTNIENLEDLRIYLSVVPKLNQMNFTNAVGVSYEKISEIAELLLKYRHHTLFNIGTTVQKHFQGGRMVQQIALLQILLGNVGKPGTGIIYSQSAFNRKFNAPLLKYITHSEHNPPIDEVPLIDLGRVLSHRDGPDAVKVLFIWNFNPASSLPDQNLLRDGLRREDLITVVLDVFATETTHFADFVIPSTFDLENDDLLTAFYIPGISRTIAGPCPYGNCLSNWDFFRKLATHMGLQDPCFNESADIIVKKSINLLPESMKNDVLSKGYSLLFHEDDLPFADSQFPTLSKKIHFPALKMDFDKVWMNRWLQREPNEFFLLSPSHNMQLHSQLSQFNKNECQRVFMHPEDLATLGLSSGQKVVVMNEYGKAILTVTESDIVMKRVVLIYSGVQFGDDPDSFNVNRFTPSQAEMLGGSGSYYSTLVTIMPHMGDD
jgi:anaerobic selenocysteine-containing dehydrogenase